MFFNFFFIIVIFLNLGLPLNNKLDVIIIMLSISVLILLKKNKFANVINKKKFFISIIIITFININVPKFFFNELNQVFVNKQDINLIASILPDHLINDINKDFKSNFDFERFLNSHYWNEEEALNQNFIKKAYSYSADSFFQKNKFSRINSSLNFNSREELRIGQINSLNYNLIKDKEFRRQLPYYVLFELDNNYKTSEICLKGKFYKLETNKKLFLSDLKNNSFKKIRNRCVDLNFKNNFIYLFGYSINKKDNLEISAKYSFKVNLIKFSKYFLTLLIIILFLINFYESKKIYTSIIYVISSISTIILTLIRDPNLFTGLRYYRGGADGLLHYSYGRDILMHIEKNNFYMALRGGEDIFYFMPGLRYFSAFNNILFGETTYGYLILCTFIPFIIFKIFKKLINNKIATYFFISFIFLPIFENMGFGYFNYVWQFARHHAESLSILFFLYGFYLVLCLEKKLDNSKPIFLIGILFSMCVFLRPNFLPSSLIIFICALIFIFQKNDHKNLLINLIGFSFLFICLIHNIYFGGSSIFFTQAAVNFKLSLFSFFDAILSIFKFNFINENLIILKSQLFLWNPIYNIHRIIILLFITYKVFFKRQTILIYALFLCAISQHGLLLLSHPSGRYAYLAWLLTFILFGYFIGKIKFNKTI